MLRTLLLVWDADIKESLSACLKKMSSQLNVVGQTSSVAEGVSLYRDLTPDLVVVAERMMDGSGMSFLQQIPQDECERVFLCSSEDSRLEALVYGAVTGRDDQPEIMRAISQIMTRRRYTINDRCNNYFHSLNVTHLDHVALPSEDGLVWISPSEIMKVVGGKECSEIVQAERRTDVLVPMKKMIRLLGPMGFVLNDDRELVPSVPDVAG